MLIPCTSARYEALIELNREAFLLEERLKPITAELNAYPLRVNKATWLKNLAVAEENSSFLIDYCQFLANDEYFRPNSPTDCTKALKTTRSDKDTLAELYTQGSLLAGAILDSRSTISRRSQLRKWKLFAEVGFVRCYWDSLGTPHGRYSSDSPCLCNRILPIRETIESDPGWSFISLDLSQAEYVTWASLSGDSILGKAFEEGRDFHTERARSIKAVVPAWNPGEDIRAAGKTINFAILYQMTAIALARKLGCSVELANDIIDAYFKSAPTATIHVTDILARAERLGYVETFYGRRRYCPEYQSATGRQETHELEKTIWHHHNAGTAAELLKWKQVRAWEELRRVGLTKNDVRLALNMYDEAIWHAKDQVLTEVKEITESIWTQREEGFLPLQVTVKIGKTWGEVSK